MSTLYVNNIEPVSGSALTLISASLIAVDDLTVTSLTSSFQGDLQGTASFATTASHALNSTSPSGVSGAIQFSDGSAFASDAANLFWDDTNNRLGIGTNAPTGRIQIVTDDAVNPQAFSNQTSLLAGTASQGALISAFSSTNGAFLNSLWPGNAWLKFNYGGLNHNFSVAGVVTAVIDSNTTFGNGTTSLGARVGIKGSGNDATTNALLVQNSAGTQLFKINDNRDVFLGSSTNYIHQGIFFQGDYYGVGNWNFGTASNLGARLGIKGSGTTSATTSLLVQNSAGTQNLNVKDNGEIIVGNADSGFKYRSGVGLDLGQVTSGGGGGWVVQMYDDSYSKKYAYFSQNGVQFGSNITSTPSPSAQLQVDSTTRGFLPPRMTTTQKNAISTPASGLMVYDTDLNQMSYYNGTSWVNF
jgi:hypothetical protein